MSSSGEQPIDAVELIRTGRPYWLPPTGHGNGLDTLFWVPIADVPHELSEALLRSLRERDVPAWVDRVTTHQVRLARTRRRATEVPETDRIWVATARFDTAEDVIMWVLNANRDTN
jgi:hypothetical protein